MINTVEDRIRMTIGDLNLQLMFAQQQIADLQAQLAAKEAEQPKGKPNGKAHEEPKGAATQ